MKNQKSILFSSVLILLIISLFITGCDHGHDHDHNGHADAEGLVLVMNGVEIVKVWEGKVTGKITVKAGEETPLIRTFFLDDHQDRFAPEEKDFFLMNEIANTDIAEFEQHSSDGKWNFHIEGKSAGSTTIVLKLMHVDHVDFLTPPVTIEVTE